MQWSSGARAFPLFLFTLALSLRLLFLQGWLPLLETRQTPIYGDAAGYYLSAVVLLGMDGGPVQEAELDRRDNSTWTLDKSWDMMKSRGPGYTLFLAGIFRLFGQSPWPVRYAQAVLGALVCVCLGLVAAHLAGRRAGWVSGLLAAFYPSYILFTGRVLTETLSSTLLWLGVLVHLRGITRRSSAWFAAAGLLYAAGALTRPTLLATIPFLALATAFALRELSVRRASVLILVFLATMLGPLVAWNVFVRAGGDQDLVAGEEGAAFFLSMGKSAATPIQRGWSTDSRPPFDWEPFLESNPAYPLPAVANLIFFHLWYLDNLWREIPMWLHAFQRALVVVALGGLGMSLHCWRRFAPLLALWLTLSVVSIKWIEIRPNLPLMASLFVFAGLHVSKLVEHATSSRSRGTRLVLLLGFGAALAIACVDFDNLAFLFPFLDPIAVGHFRDGMVVAISCAFLCLGHGACRAGMGRRWAMLCTGLPIALFVSGFAAYAYVRSAPRWRAWELELAAERTAEQRIVLPAPLPPGSVKTAMWLVDLQTNSDEPPLRVSLNSAPLTAGQFSWRRAFCDQSDRFAKGVPGCRVYLELDRFTGAYRASPQWWSLVVDPRLVEGSTSLALMLERDARELDPDTTRVGGTYEGVVGSEYYGPGIYALTLGSRTSLYRWHVVNDWRMWSSRALDSLDTQSRLHVERGAPPKARYLEKMTDRGRAQFNIRLLVELVDGSKMEL